MRTGAILPAVLLALLLSACMRWESAPVPAPRAESDDPRLGTARVTARPAAASPVPVGQTLVLRDVRMRGDSLVGWGGGTVGARERIAVHRDQVVGLELRRRDWGRTAGVVALSVTVVYGAVVLLLTELVGA